MDIYLGNNFVVSYDNADSMPPVEKLWQRFSRDERLYINDSDFLCHALIDSFVDAYSPYLDDLEDEIDEIEDLVLKSPSPAILERISQLKRQTITLRRIIAPQRELVNRLCRYEKKMINVIRNMTTSTLEVYLNATSLRLNEVMKA